MSFSCHKNPKATSGYDSGKPSCLAKDFIHCSLNKFKLKLYLYHFERHKTPAGSRQGVGPINLTETSGTSVYTQIRMVVEVPAVLIVPNRYAYRV
ncbi:Uncharacterized protein HZ326_24266 [Fusarium oxysporum f. sp. albedinis]|nr:Uncharacterized protein HZ326_24266 [Fusarium oxysporum f. sp. albedinis]